MANVIQNLKRYIKEPSSRGIGLIFFISSWAFGSWVVNIPSVKEQLDLDEKTLGLLLFGIPLGQIFTNLLASKVIQTVGLHRLCEITTYGLLVFTVLPVYANSVPFLFISLILIGINYALLNISMNTITSVISENLRYSVVSTSHAMWSIGGMTGTLFAGTFFALGGTPKWHVIIAMTAMIPLMIYAHGLLRKNSTLNIQREKSKSPIAFSPKLLLLIVIGTFVMVAEGFAFDWSAVFLREYRGASEASAAFGFSVFMLAMTSGRFLGDTIMLMYQPKVILTIDGIIAIAGLLLAVFVNTLWAGYLGMLLLGFGVALNAPVLYSLSMKLPNILPEVGLATFATFSFVGFLAGPPLIGWFAQLYGLETSMIGVAIALFIAILLSRRV